MRSRCPGAWRGRDRLWPRAARRSGFSSGDLVGEQCLQGSRCQMAEFVLAGQGGAFRAGVSARAPELEGFEQRVRSAPTGWVALLSAVMVRGSPRCSRVVVGVAVMSQWWWGGAEFIRVTGGTGSVESPARGQRRGGGLGGPLEHGRDLGDRKRHRDPRAAEQAASTRSAP